MKKPQINKHGLNITYFKSKLNAIIRDARYYRLDEMANALERLAEVAKPKDKNQITPVEDFEEHY
jgi:hypothetical protein